MKFKLLESSHVDEEKRVFKKGDIVESFHPLDTIFKNKFERLSGKIRIEELEKPKPSDPVDEGGDDWEEEDPAVDKKTPEQQPKRKRVKASE